jgi:phosphatidylglycerol:prolipoprotein diacylglycerol transferase
MFCFISLVYYLNNPAEIFAFWQGGMSFHGGFLGVLIGMLMIAKNIKSDG